MAPSLAERFWRFVPQGLPKEVCWEWQGNVWSGATTRMDRYPILQHPVDGKWKRLLGHRVSWEIHNGPIPTGLFICHTCDNTHCVNPHHLFLGTARENTQDMLEKARGGGTFTEGYDARRQAGEHHHAAKLTQQDADRIRAQYHAYPAGAQKRSTGIHQPLMPHSLKALARDYGVSKKTILNIIHGRIWNGTPTSEK